MPGVYGLPSYLIACDPGQVSDPTGVVVAERTEVPAERVADALSPASATRRPPMVGAYDLIHIARLPLGTPYTALPGELRALEDQARRRFSDLGAARQQSVTFAQASITTVVDMTGVGRPITDLLRQSGLTPVAITITAGHEVTRVGRDEYRTPKRDLCSIVQTAMQARRLRAAPSLPFWPALQEELRNFKATISLAGHDTYAAGGGAEDWRTGGAHDDLVLATALAVWFGEYQAARSRGTETASTSYLETDDDDDRPGHVVWDRR